MVEKKSVKKTKAEATMIVEAAPENTAKITESDNSNLKSNESTTVTAKAGKRSAKSQKEVAEKTAKEERKKQVTDTRIDEKPAKPTVKPTRSRFERRGKKYRQAAALFEKNKSYNLPEGIELATKTNPVKFDATVELHIRLNVDPKQADQNVRDTLVLPSGTGKTVRVAVFADTNDATIGKKAGADITGIDEIIKQLDKNQFNFDVLIAHPSQMAKLGKYARILGPRGLMPNPKSGTVTTDISKAVSEAKAGRVEYRVDSTGIIHIGIGKVSFGTEKLVQNAQAVITSVKNNKPASVKSGYVKSAYISTSMGPSILTVLE